MFFPAVFLGYGLTVFDPMVMDTVENGIETLGDAMQIPQGDSDLGCHGRIILQKRDIGLEAGPFGLAGVAYAISLSIIANKVIAPVSAASWRAWSPTCPRPPATRPAWRRFP